MIENFHSTYEDSTGVLLWMQVFSDVTPCHCVSFGWHFKRLYCMHLPGFRVKLVHSSATSGNLTQDPVSPLIGPGSSDLLSFMWSNTTCIALLSHVAVDSAIDSTWSVWSVTAA